MLAVQPEEKGVPQSKWHTLSKMVEKCASDLTVEQKEQLFQLLMEYADIFADAGEIGRTD